MSKRTKFVLVAVFLGILLAISGSVAVDYRLTIVLAITAISYVLSVWVLFEDLKGIEWINLMILPVLFTLGAGLFANLMPSVMPSFWGRRFDLETGMLVAKIVKILFYILYVVGMYGLLLAENIFSVASIRTIQLLRAARSVTFVMSLVVFLFLTTMILSLRLPFWFIGLMTLFPTFALVYQVFWSVDLKTGVTSEVIRYSVVVAILMALTASVLSFWPVKLFMGALMLTAVLYGVMGAIEQKMQNRLYRDGGWEYLLFGLVIIVIGLFSTQWRG